MLLLGFDDAPLPLGYGSDTLELMVRDPMSAYAYWDLSGIASLLLSGLTVTEELFCA